MPDLPDYYTMTSMPEAEAWTFRSGAFAARPADPDSSDIYFATDTQVLYICVTDGIWTGFDASILVQGTLTLYANVAGGGFQINNIADPTANQDAATKVYADGLTTTHAGLTTGIHGVGASTIASLLQLTTHAALTTTTHGVGAGAIVGTTLAQVLTNKTLTTPTINGLVVTTGLTLPTFTLNGAVVLAGQVFDAGVDDAEIHNTSASKGLIIKSTQAGTAGGRLVLQLVNPVGAVDDSVGQIYAYGRDDAGASELYGAMEFMIEDPAAASPDGYIKWLTRRAGANNIVMTLSSAGKLWLNAGLEVGGNIVMATHRITGLGDPAAAQDAATKAYADTKAKTTSGNYTGDDTVDRTIPHGLGAAPKIVFIVYSTASDDHGDKTWQIITGIARIFMSEGGLGSSLGVTTPDATNFHVGNDPDYVGSANKNAYVYLWVAIS